MSVELAQKDVLPTGPRPGPVPQAAVDYLKKKKLKPGFSYKDVWAAEHRYAFTIAKVMEASILKTMQRSIEKALENGTAFEDWQETVEPVLEQSGWRAHVSDKAKPSRLQTIYQTNMRMARANGQHDRIQRTKKVLPFLKYELGPSKNHRKEHVAWAGTILPVDDEFWKDRYPPSTYGCKCRVRQISRLEAEESGGETEAPNDQMVKWQLPNGDEREVPAGVHPTFAYPKGSDGREQSLSAALKASTKDEGGPKEMAHSMDGDVGMLVRTVVEVLTTSGVTKADFDRAWSGEPVDPEARAMAVARKLSDGARRTLAELVAMCPGPFDTTGVSKFTGDQKTTRKHLRTELVGEGLVGERSSHGQLALYPTEFARAVSSLLARHWAHWSVPGSR